MNEGSGVVVVPRQPVMAVSPGAAYSTPAMGIPTPSPFSFSVASTRWSSSRPYNYVFGLVLRAMVMLFSFGSSLALAVTMSNNSHKPGFQDYPEFVYSFIITAFVFVYSAYQLSKGICDIAYKGILISDKTSDYTSFILDQLAGYLLVSCSAVTAVMINQQPLSGNRSLKRAATAYVFLSVASFLTTAVCAILSGYKLSKRVMW